MIFNWKTENGWPACDAASCNTGYFPGTKVYVPLQVGPANTVLKAFGADFNEFVEPLEQHHCGGWTPTNSVATSNHLGGTAMDLNWQYHPLGPTAESGKAGFSPEKIGTVRELLDFYEKNVFWGNDWNTPKDSMHFQMGYGTYANLDKLNDFISRKIQADGRSTFGSTRTPVKPSKPVVPGSGGTFWADVSHYQDIPIDSSYPHKVFAFRTNSGNEVDRLVAANAKRAVELLDSGKLEIVIAYYFFRPGQANCDLHRKLLQDNGLWGHGRLITMVDVEGDGGKITGDNSWEINDEIARLRSWYGNPNRVIGYWNPNADPNLWKTRPRGLKLVIPQYNRVIGDLSSIQNKAVLPEAFAHQFTSSDTNTPPWGGKRVDVNWSPSSVDELLDLFEMSPGGTIDPVPPTTPPPVVEEVTSLNTRVASNSRYRADDQKRWTLAQLIQFIDARSHEAEVERSALFGHPEAINLVVRQAKRGDRIALGVLGQIPPAFLKDVDLTGITFKDLQ